MIRENALSIGELAARAGVAPATLRMWEERHGFPRPQRLESGHRRYSAEESDRVTSVARQRDAGMPLALAIAQVLAAPSADPQSIFANLRRANPTFRPHTLQKAALIAISRALEDEYLASGEHGLLAASFQRATFFEAAQVRWNELSRMAQASFVLADFRALATPKGGPARVPVSRDLAVGREWAVVCDAPRFSACLVGVETAPRPGQRDLWRRFEAIWTFEPSIVRQAAELAVAIASARAPRLADSLRRALAHEPAPLDARMALSASERMVAYVAARATP